MARWTKILCDFDAEEETVNFGTRNFAETNKSIYETWTLATIQSETKVVNNPKISATLLHSHLCVVVDNCITIFSSQSCQSVLSSIGFDAPITSYCLSSNIQFLFLAIQPATLYCFDLHANGSQLFSIDFYKQYYCSSIIKICLEESDNTLDPIIVASDAIFKITDFNSFIGDNKTEHFENISKKIVSLKKLPAINHVYYRAIESTNSSIITLSNDQIYLHPEDIACSTRNLPYQYTKVQFFNGYNSMISLRSDGKLSIICPYTLLGKQVFDGPVIDFVTLNEESDTFNLLVLMACDDIITSKSSLHLMTFPDFKIIFTMSVASTTHLVDVIGNDPMDLLIILEGMKNTNDIIDVIRVKAIEESIPEDRLQRLLRQKRFNEAQVFAKKYSLNSEYIYQAEISILLQQLYATEDVRVDLDIFITALDQINDIKFIYQCCNHTLSFNDYWSTKNLYEYLKKRIMKYLSSDEKNSEILLLLRDINKTLKRIETFDSIQKTLNDDSITVWNYFLKANLIGECARYLSIGNLRAAALIWTRHTSSIVHDITESKVRELLGTIPSNLTPDDMWTWLQYFIPSVILFLPDVIEEIIQWAYNKTKSLEQSHRDYWPEIGLKFIQGFVDLLCFEEYNNRLQINQQYINKTSKFHRLMGLMQALSDLLELKVEYKIILPLNVYQSEPINVINIILNKVHVDGVPNLMKNFVHQYMAHHCLENDQALSKYIKSTLNSSKHWWIGDKAPWDRRLTVIIGYINNIKIRCEQIIDMLKKAPVPWSDNLISLVQQSYTYDCPLVAQIRAESDYVAVKLIQKKYGFAQIAHLSPKLYNNIIKQNNPSMIQDLLELTKQNNDLRLKVFYNCVNYYLNKGDIDQVMKIMQQLTDDLLLNCCKQIINIVKLKLNSSKDVNHSLKHYFVVFGSIERLITNSVIAKNGKCAIEFNDILKTIPLLKKLYRLHTEFNIFITFEGYHVHKENILLDFVKKTVLKIDEQTVWLDVCQQIERLRGLLDLPKFYGIYSLLKLLQKSVAIKEYLFNRFQNCYSTFPEECEYLNKVCYQLVVIADNDPQLALFLKRLYASILLHSKKSSLAHNLTIANRIDAYNVAVGAEIIQDNQPTPSEFLKLYPIYRDVLSLAGNDLLLVFNKNVFDISTCYQTINEGNQMSEELKETIRLLNKNILDNTVVLENDHHNYSLYKILSIGQAELISVQADNDQLIKIQVLLKSCAGKLLKDLLRSRLIDTHLGLSCLLMLPESDALKVLISTNTIQLDSSREKAIHDLGYEYCKLIGNSYIGYFDNQKLLYAWAQRLVPYEISVTEVLQSDITGKKDILQRVMKSKQPGIIDLLQEFCNNFAFDFQECLLSYLRILLFSWKPKYHLETTNDGQQFKIDNTDVVELKNLCTKIINKIQTIDNSQSKSMYLDNIIPLINFYYYEILIILLELSDDKKVDKLSYLYFLQSYTRVGAITDLEKEAWEQFSQDDHPMPEVARWRLPFLPEANQYKLITPELNLKTYEKWLIIAAVLKMPTYTICTIAVKGAVAETWLNKKYVKKCSSNSNEWALQSTNNHLLQDMKRCINHLQDPSDLQYKAAAWYYIVTHAPSGADQVEAAKECYNYAQQWQELDDTITPAHTKLIKIQSKYYKYTSNHILFTYGLGQDKYLTLVEHPEKLIRELYKDESIPQRYKAITKKQPDINSAVNELGKLFILNLIKIRLDFLNEWLHPKTWDSNKSDDTTINIYQELNTTNDTASIDDELLRACYIVNSGNSVDYINYLINISFNEVSGQTCGPGMRYRALLVIQSIMNEAELLNYIKRDRDSIHKYIKSLQYLGELEKHGIHYSVSGFENCSKQKLAEILINSQYSTPRALGLIPRLYIDFKLSNYGLLNTALERMVRYSLVDQLKVNLLVLGTHDCISNCSGYISAWQLVVQDTFNKLDAHPSNDVVNKCIEILRMLHACPIIDKLQFDLVIKHCIHTKQMHFAIALLPFLNEIIKYDVINSIKDSPNYEETMEKLSELKKKGILIVYNSAV